MDTDHTVLPAQTQLGVPGSVGPGLHHGGCMPRPRGSQPTLLRSWPWALTAKCHVCLSCGVCPSAPGRS